MKTLIFVIFVLVNGQTEFKVYETPDPVDVCQQAADAASKQALAAEGGGKYNDIRAWCVSYEPGKIAS